MALQKAIEELTKKCTWSSINAIFAVTKNALEQKWSDADLKLNLRYMLVNPADFV